MTEGPSRGAIDGRMRAALTTPVIADTTSSPGNGHIIEARTTTHRPAKPGSVIAARTAPSTTGTTEMQNGPRKASGKKSKADGEATINKAGNTGNRLNTSYLAEAGQRGQAADAGGGRGDTGNDKAPPTPEEPNPEPFSKQWLTSVELTRGAATLAATRYMKRQAQDILGESFDEDLWRRIMLPVKVYTPGGSYHDDVQSVHAQSMLRAGRELSRRWDLDGNSPEMQYLAVKTFLTTEQERRTRNGDKVELRQMTDEEKTRLRTAKPEERKQVRQAILESARERPVEVFDEREAKARVMAGKLEEFARTHKLGEQEIKMLDDISQVALLDTIVQERRLNGILNSFVTSSGIDLASILASKKKQQANEESQDQAVPLDAFEIATDTGATILEIILTAQKEKIDIKVDSVPEDARERDETDRDWLIFMAFLEPGEVVPRTARYLTVANLQSGRDFRRRSGIQDPKTIAAAVRGTKDSSMQTRNRIIDASPLDPQGKAAQNFRVKGEPWSISRLESCNFAELLGYVITLKGMTHNELADALGISPKNVDEWLLNRSHPRRLDEGAVKELLGGSHNDLLAYILLAKSQKRSIHITSEGANKLLAGDYLFAEHLQQLEPYPISKEDEQILTGAINLRKKLEAEGDANILGKVVAYVRGQSGIAQKILGGIGGNEQGRFIPQPHKQAEHAEEFGYKLPHPIARMLVDLIYEEKERRVTAINSE